MVWRKTIAIKQFFNHEEGHKEVQETMNKIADELDKHSEFSKELIKKMRNIPQGDDLFKPIDYADRFLDEVYNIADSERIWIV